MGTHVRYEVSSRPRLGLESFVERLEQHRFVPLGAAVEEEERHGWITLEHLLDVAFRPDKIELGPYVAFALRRDRRKAPAALVRAHVRQEELAHLNLTGKRLPPKQRRDLRQRVRDELITQVLPSASSWPVVWHLRDRRLWFGTGSQKANELFVALFRETFELDLVPLGAGALAHRLGGGTPELGAQLTSLRPTPFILPGIGEQATEPVLVGAA
jgi:hypothetical protein